MDPVAAPELVVQCDDGRLLKLKKRDHERSGLLRDLPSSKKSSAPLPLPFSWQTVHDWRDHRPDQLSMTRLMEVVAVRACSASCCAAVHIML